MNRVIVKTLAVLAAAAFATAALSQITAGAREYPQERVNTITVYGEGRVRFKNDTAVLNIGVETSHRSSSEALKANSAKMDAVIAAVKGKGITDAEISTSNISIYPRYDYVYGTSVLKDYSAQNMIKVCTQNMNILGEIMAAASEAGANIMNGIDFSLNNSDSYKINALGQAVTNAEYKARLAAGSAGLPLGDVVSIREYYAQSPSYACDSVPMFKSSGASAVPIMSGEGEICARVEVVYKLY